MRRFARAAALRPRFRAGSAMSSASLVTAAVLLARLKLFANTIGVGGTGVVAQVSATQGLLVSLSPLYSGIGLVTVLAKARLDDFGSARSLAAARGLALCVSLVAVAAAVLCIQLISPAPDVATVLMIGLAGVPFAALLAVEHSALQARAMFGRLAASTAAGSVLSLALITALTLRAGVHGAAVGLSVALAAGWLVAFLALEGVRRPEVRVQRDVWRALIAVGSGALFMSVASSAGEAAIRYVALALFGATGAGIIHPLQAMSLQIPLVLGSGLAAFATTRIANYAAGHRIGEVASELRRVQELGTIVGGTAVLVMSGTAVPLIRLLLTEEFDALAVMVPLQLLGEFLRVQSWLLGLYLLPLGHRGAFMATAPLYYGIYFTVVAATAPHVSLAAFPLGHVLGSAAVAALVSAHSARTLPMVPRRDLALFALVCGGLFGAAYSAAIPLMTAALLVVVVTVSKRWRSV